MSTPNSFYMRVRQPVRRVLRAVADFLSNLDPRFHYKRDVAWCHDLAWTRPYEQYLRHDGRGGRRILDRRFTIVQMAQAVSGLRGCTAECGVARGVGSALICQTLADTYRNYELHVGFDSFEGVAAPTDEDRMSNGRHHWYKGKLGYHKVSAFELLKDMPLCHLVKGWIPDTFAPFAHKQFRFVHIDVDLHDATRDSLAFFYPRMVPGGILLFDDHGFASCPGARKAATQFFADKPDRLIELATGQAFVIRETPSPARTKQPMNGQLTMLQSEVV